MGCECYQIGGPWIAEDPSCEAHGQGGLQEQLNDAEAEISRLRDEIVQLKLHTTCDLGSDCPCYLIGSSGAEVRLRVVTRLNHRLDVSNS